MIKIWTGYQVDLLEEKNQLLNESKIPEEVILAVRNTISILDDAYGSNRDLDGDLGGYVCIFNNEVIGECKDYHHLLNKYGLSVEIAEFTEPIMTKEYDMENQTYQWFLQLFILSSDYSISIIYKDII